MINLLESFAETNKGKRMIKQSVSHHLVAVRWETFIFSSVVFLCNL